MKHTKRILAVLLAAALLTGLLPAAVLTAQAVDPAAAEPDQLTAAMRSTVMLDASGLKKADTVILGYAENSGTYYPLEWLIGDAKQDSTGRTGGRLLISKYLLPAATIDTATGGIDTDASYDTISMPDGTTTAIHMPDSTAVLPTYKADTDYIANIGSNLGKYSLLYPADVNAGLSVRGDDAAANRRALEGALFFSLSAREAESSIANAIDNLSENNTSKLLRRPYAANYAVSSAGDRSWALRGQTLRGDAIAMCRGASHFTYDHSAEGLVREAGENTLSRPAFNLRTNAVSFWYAVTVKPNANGTNTAVTPKEIAVDFGADEELEPVGEQSGTLSWRAALETLPMTSASTVYHDDGTVELDFYNDAKDQKIGLLTADSTGKLLSYGTVRKDTQGGHAFYKPGANESKLYFFVYDYDAKTHQLCTSNLIEVSAQRSSAMMLGAGVLKSGDNVVMNDNSALVLNAETGIPDMANTGSSGSLTESNNKYDERPVFNQDAMLMLADTGNRVNYGTSKIAETVAESLPFLSSTRYNDGYAQELARTQAYINADAETGTTAAKAANAAILARQEDYFDSAFNETYKVDSPLSKAIPYTWLSDSAYTVQTFINDSSPVADTAVSAAKEDSVCGKQLFFLSAGEFQSLPVIIKGAVGTSLLRSAVTETFNIPATSDKLTLVSEPAATYSAKVATLNSFYYCATVSEKAAFHLRKDRIVYAFQSSAIDRTVTSADDLHPVGTYASSGKNWEIAVLDDSIQPYAYFSTGFAPNQTATFSVMNMPEGRANSWAALLVTDRAGTVKQYGRISSLESSSLNEFTIDTNDYDYGDRLYLVYEYETGHAAQPVVYATEPVVIWEKKLDGTVAIDPSPYKPGESLYADISEVRYDPGMQPGFGWYSLEQRDLALGTNQTYVSGGSLPCMDVFVYDRNDPVDRLTASAELVAELPVYPGEKDPDFFKGGTLYYGADSDADTADYAWTVVGHPSSSIVAAKDASGIPLYEAAHLNNAVELLRKTATPQGSTDTVLRGYMETGVMLTDIRDELINKGNLKADAYSAENQTVFQMSYTDHIALDSYPTARFAAAQNSSWGREYVLRNHKASKYLTVNPLLNLQSATIGANACTREGINLNNQTVVFYSPADCELTYDALLKCRQTPQGEWKATVSQPELFEDFMVEHVQNSFCSVSLYGSFDQPMEDRYITVWGVKDGKIVWMDSKACEGTGFSLGFEWDQSLTFDDLYFVARKDNGVYRSDVCSDLYSAYPTGVLVRAFLNDEEMKSFDDYVLLNADGEESDRFVKDDLVNLNVFAPFAANIQRIEVVYSDGTKVSEDQDGTTVTNFAFTFKGVRPTVNIYLETTKVDIEIETIVEPLYDLDYPDDVVTVSAPTQCRQGERYDFTVNVQPGYYIRDIVCESGFIRDSLPNPNPVTIVADGEILTGYAPGTYTKEVGVYGDHIFIYVSELPFSLQLAADPQQGGTVTATLPEERSLTTLAAGDTVTVTAQPNEGYVLRGFTLKTQDGEETELTAENGSCTFTMPNENVIVTAHFVRLNTVTVKLFKDGKQVDTGASWTLKDAGGTECSIFAAGDRATVSAKADTGLVISHIKVTYSDGTSTGAGSLSSAQDFDFTVRDTDPVVGIYLTQAQVPVEIVTQTVDAKGNELDEQGGTAYAPTYISYGDSFNYNASAFEGYYISAIYRNDVLVPNTEPTEYTSAGKTVIGYGAEEYLTAANGEYVSIVVQFTKLVKAHTVTSDFVDVSLAAPVPAAASVTYTVNGAETDVFYAGDTVTATVSCAGNMAVASTEAEPSTELTQTDKYTFTFTMPDDDLAVTYNLKKLAIKSAYLHVNEDINLIYTVQVPDGFTNAAAEFTFMDNTYQVTDYTVGTDGRYSFEFENVTPQHMGEPVDVTVTANYGDYSFSHTNSGYSVRKYCVNMLGKSTDSILRTLLADILVYGEKAQRYTGYKTDALVTDGVDLADASTYPGLSGLTEKFVGAADPNTFWKAASLHLRNNVTMNLFFCTDDTTNLSVKVSIDGRTETFTDFTQVEGQPGVYCVSFRDIMATEFGATVSAEFFRSGAKVGNTLKYTVNTYICSKQADSDETLANLVKVLYNYGVSALTYYNERILKK